MRRAALAGLLLWAAPAAAQPVDCQAEGLTPAQVAACADAALQEAEAELDETFRLALTRAKVFDEATLVEGTATAVTLETALEQSQEDFLSFRDTACDAEALTFRSAIGAPVAAAICRARLSMRRVEDLRFFGEIE